jgi:hypothetical protein
MTRGTVGPSRFSRRDGGGGTKLRVGLEQTEIDGKGYQGPIDGTKTGLGESRKGCEGRILEL